MNKHPLQKSMITLFLCIFLIFGFLFAAAAELIWQNANNDYKTRSAETATNNAVSTIQASLMNYNYLTRLMMINERIVNYLKADRPDQNDIYEARRGIYEIQNLYSYIDSVYIFRNDEKYVSTERALYYIDLESEEHQKILDAKGSTVISINGNGMIRKSTDDQLLTLARAIYDINSQKLIGMLIMNVSSKYFDTTLIEQYDEEMCIYDKYGNILCGYGELKEIFDTSSARYEGTTSFCEGKIHGQNKVMAKAEGLDPFIVICSSGKNAHVISNRLMLAFGLLVISFMISVIIWIIFVSKNIVKPIGRLSGAMAKTKSSGWMEKFDAKMPENELGELADDYNTMVDYLNALFNQTIENEKNIQKAEMRVLQEQIKPHFLYNTLETISYLALEENAPKAHEALEHLGNFYRNFLSKGNREIPLKREVRITADYLALQQMRYGNVFKAEYDIDEATSKCIIPKLILQPLVENAIYHGVRPKGDDEGVIRITTRLVGEELVIIVYDSGLGMRQEKIDEILSGSYDATDSFGLAGTIDRIKYFCSDRDVVSIRSEEGEYTEIEIRIPAVFEENP